MITDAKLQFWIKNNLNVLFIGSHGVGKTARIKQAFDQAGLKWLYFSASTLDPWVDFIGIPKEAQDENGNKYIELIRPKPFADDEVEAIFLDEYNRSPKKVRNATMELLQFKSINGKRFNNLKIVWAAINPEEKDSDGSGDMEYDVEKLDPAQKDRFEIHVEVPFKPDRGYFIRKFGDELAENGIDWWNDLDSIAKKSVSPRRLDYALNVYSKGGDVRDVLPNNVNVSKLIAELKSGSYVKQMKVVFSRNDPAEAKTFMYNRNNYDNTIQKILKDDALLNFFLPAVREEDLITLMSSDKKVYDYVIANFNNYQSIIQTILNVNVNSPLSKRLKKEPNVNQMFQSLKASILPKKVETYTFSNTIFQSKPKVNNAYSQSFGGLGNVTYSTFINDPSIYTTISKGTQYRSGVFCKILENITDNESNADYVKTLNVLSEIIASSHPNSLTQTFYKGFYELFGYVIVKCVKTGDVGITPAQVIKNIKMRSNRMDKVETFLFNGEKFYV